MQARPPRTTDLTGPITALSTNVVPRSSAAGEHAKDVPLESVGNDVSEYNGLYHAHRGRVLRLCRLLLSDPDEADDVSQEVFLKLFRQHELRSSAIAWGPWLTRVTVNACRDRRRSGWWKWWRERHRSFEEADLPGHGSTPEEEVLSRERREDIWHVFQQLSSRQREVFVLRQLEGFATDEVAEILGVSSGSIKRHLYRAVHQLRTALRGLR